MTEDRQKQERLLEPRPGAVPPGFASRVMLRIQEEKALKAGRLRLLTRGLIGLLVLVPACLAGVGSMLAGWWQPDFTALPRPEPLGLGLLLVLLATWLADVLWQTRVWSRGQQTFILRRLPPT